MIALPEEKSLETDHYRLLSTTDKLMQLLTHARLFGSLEATASWLTAAEDSAHSVGTGHRIATYFSGGRMEWLYSHGNTGETISAWLDLAKLLKRPNYQERAVYYAGKLLDDPVKGLYRGKDREAWGLPWYWTDGGTYSGLYAMRLPFHFHRLYEATEDERYLDICDVIGQTLLRRQMPSGIVSAAWDAKTGWLREARVGSRYLYAVAAFATLWRITGNEKYHAAYEKSLAAMFKMQNADGSFFQHYVPETAEAHPTEKSIKPFFYGYILNAIAEAYSIFPDERILNVAIRLGNCLAGLYYYRKAIPYCTGNMLPADQTEAEAFVIDSANGLLWLAEQTTNDTFFDVGIKLWFDAWQSQLNAPDHSAWHGAIIQGTNPQLSTTLEGVPSDRIHLRHEPEKLGKCSLWSMVNHVFATKRLIENHFFLNENRASNLSGK